MSSQGMEIPNRCFVNAIKVVKTSEAASSDTLTEADIKNLIELKPPIQMPQGNVGTPSEYFHEQIRLCKLPPSVIAKLGIQSGRRIRKFEAVPFQYSGNQDEEEDYEDEPESEENSKKEETQKDNSINEEEDPLDPTSKIEAQQNYPDNDEGPDNDDDQCEEWERHEALHNDVTEQERTKERHYEEEMEIVWEKGGPGLVWYTDTNFWDETEKGTDCDWNWADDWDVDYSVYYEGKSAGELDARQAVEMREDEELRSGKIEKSVFTKKVTNSQGRGARKRRHSGSTVDDIEKHTKGIGSKLLSRMGWKAGKGLGAQEQGRVEPVAVDLEEDGQSGREKKGFGYRGEKLQRTGFQKQPKRHLIASV
ncbi:hypothetical protein WR25_01441 isoform B [Diploscapter pachys]|nr:hypothetical protein WR25_01441 isoform B [Diploscapter pachys]